MTEGSKTQKLDAETIVAAVASFGLSPLAAGVPERFSAYFDLLQYWNARLNLTAIRAPEEILRRHFLECIFCAQELPPGVVTLLDYGSGAGFPGIPVALCRPEIHVTLAESQGKKASFLHEAVRSLGMNAEVYAGRVEDMRGDRLFDAVAMRAVDKMQQAIHEAAGRVKKSGWLVLLASRGSVDMPEGFIVDNRPIPASDSGSLIIARRSDVPRETSPQD